MNERTGAAMRRVILGTLLSIFAVLPASGSSVPKVFGISIGQTLAQVTGLLRTIGITPHVIRSRCFSEIVALRRSPVSLGEPTGRCVSSMIWRQAKTSVMVSFSEDYPLRPSTSIVTGVTQTNPSGIDIETLKHQYGRPTLTESNVQSTIALWCFDFQCSSIDRTLGDMDSGIYVFANSRSGVSLVDRRKSAELNNGLWQALNHRGIRPAY